MLEFLRSKPFRDEALGELVRSRGRWRGSMALEAGRVVPVALTGGRQRPEAEALAAARAALRSFELWRPAIAQALFEHYAPYAEELAAGRSETADGSLPRIEHPDRIWPYVSLVHVACMPLGGAMIAELGYAVRWDDDHTIGVRFHAGALVELCGSVLPP